MAYLIDGKAISKQIKDELKEEVALLNAKGIFPCLAVIQVGQDPASCVFVIIRKKHANILESSPFLMKWKKVLQRKLCFS